MTKEAIGIFDSGIGGTSIFNQIKERLPNENFIYLADSKNAPYGDKSKDDIIALSIKNTELLLTKNCKLIVVACNTATTNAIKVLRHNYSIPFIGIEPAIKPAALNTKSNAIGILATKGTLSSTLFHEATDLYSQNISVIEQVGTGIVPLIEKGNINTPEMRKLLQNYLEPMLRADIDYLVLGCTHYPYLTPLLTEILPKHVKIIDATLAVARQTEAVLKQNKLLNRSKTKGSSLFYSNGNTTILNSILGGRYPINTLDF